jgi:hypothetical protein
MEPGPRAKAQERGEVWETVEEMALRAQRVRPCQARDRALAKDGDRIANAVPVEMRVDKQENSS